ncbi:hypothetical protein [Cecembia sp.]|uniref:hypothetical protein n=1 Tax=Cecembia sp. TaxID=1898110 RepID=UPI0025C4B84E|nr:hypothetical protein [Cecembia sp.]
MKKLSLEMLRLTSDEVLGRSQMKKITGGYGGNYRYCHCTTGAGSWSGYYSSDQAAANAVAQYCEGGNGACTPY